MQSCNKDVPILASTQMKTRVELIAFVDRLLSANLSPIFEFIGPQNQIVLKYRKADFVFLGLRDMSNGVYVPPLSKYFTNGIPDAIRLPGL